MNKIHYFEGKYKKWFIIAVVCIIMGGWFWYMLWASSISHNTILKNRYLNGRCIFLLVY